MFCILRTIHPTVIVLMGLTKEHLIFYLTAIHGCGYCFHPSWAGWAGCHLSDLCDHKLEKVHTWHTCYYHGLVVQRHGQTRVETFTLTL